MPFIFLTYIFSYITSLLPVLVYEVSIRFGVSSRLSSPFCASPPLKEPSSKTRWSTLTLLVSSRKPV